LPHHLFTGAATVIAPKGVGMFIAVQEISHDRDFLMNSIGGNDASFTEESGILFDNTKDYVMWALTGRREKFPVREELNELGPSELQQAALTMTDEWGDRLRKLIQLTDTRTITPLQIQSSIPIEHWETKRITLIGDAIHSMTPFRGIGANVALRDAQLLNLTAAHRGEKELIQAIHDYEKEMIQYGFDAVRSSLKQADQSVSENVIGLWMMKTAFRFLNAVPPLKRLAFRGFGEQ
jgi:salicylate hydroxylase